ncbi:uncharacterized protein LOC124910421 [Impatiens glandulifera]|uniref:uncharacterized protein LOC124910421 n=1 Tax=Impatiens glandulifera TaxID=253017 RepID=UPI001FB18D9B|nr:uncharacterized protein LOC124910421 [Impatiens glandulifera]
MTQKSHNKSQIERNKEMKGRTTENRAADLLVCFPSRAHLTLMPMPKPNFSPNRQPSDPPNNHNRRLTPSTLSRHRRSRSRAGPSNCSQSRPTEIAEPTSPKVTCAGQIKIITPKPKTCKNWQSVMEEIERLHNSRKQRKKSTWAESLGFKKDAYQFLTCLRHLRFDFRCFGSSDPPTTTDEDDEDDYHNETQMGIDHDDDKESSRTVFSKWFMVLQEEQNNIIQIKEESCAPPPNALLLMRCRSAPVKNWLHEEEKEKKKEKSNSLEVLMKCDAEFFNTKDQLLRSRTWKR